MNQKRQLVYNLLWRSRIELPYPLNYLANGDERDKTLAIIIMSLIDRGVLK